VHVAAAAPRVHRRPFPDPERAMTAPPVAVQSFVPYVHVLDVARAIAFYAHLGFRVANEFRPEPGGALAWASLVTDGGTRLMLARGSGTIDAPMQAVMFYAYVADVAAVRAAFAAAGLPAGPLQHPWYAPAGEFRSEDPDGYVVMVMQG
jgi:catechol 2,3-dioxygenase-like lactoylglutathione lyase family enzyme